MFSTTALDRAWKLAEEIAADLKAVRVELEKLNKHFGA